MTNDTDAVWTYHVDEPYGRRLEYFGLSEEYKETKAFFHFHERERNGHSRLLQALQYYRGRGWNG